MQRLDEPLSLLLFSFTCKPSYLFMEGTCEGGVITTEEPYQLHQAGTHHHRPLSLKSLCSPRQREERESILCVMDPVCLSSLCQGKQVAFSLSLSLPATPKGTHLPGLCH